MDWLDQYPYIAHRGFHDGSRVVENTANALIQAIDKSYAIEFDLQFLSNGTPILFHDAEFKRLCDDSTKVKDLNPKFLSLLSYSDGQKIITLTEALKIVDGKVPLLIEIKRETFQLKYLKPLIAILNTYQGKFSIQSFDPNILKEVKKKSPNISIGQLMTNWFQTDISFLNKSIMNFAPFFNDLNFISVNQEMSETIISIWENVLSLPILFWTIKNQAQLNQLKTIGSGFIFEGFCPSPSAAEN